MKKRKRDIISFLIIILLMAFILMGTHYMSRNKRNAKETIDLWLMTEIHYAVTKHWGGI